MICIAAQVLVKSHSGFSDMASIYSAGVKLFFLNTIDTAPHTFNLELFGLRDALLREEFVCTLLKHLAWKHANPVEISRPWHGRSTGGKFVAKVLA